jgi:hypothetical protein
MVEFDTQPARSLAFNSEHSRVHIDQTYIGCCTLQIPFFNKPHSSVELPVSDTLGYENVNAENEALSWSPGPPPRTVPDAIDSGTYTRKQSYSTLEST